MALATAVTSDRVVQTRLSANGTRVALLNPNSQRAAILDLRQRQIHPTRISGVGNALTAASESPINSPAPSASPRSNWQPARPFAVWHSDEGTSHFLEVHHPSDTGWNLQEIREVAFSPDDRFVVFTRIMVSAEPPQLRAAFDVFPHDLQTGGTNPISVNRHGAGPGNGFSGALGEFRRTLGRFS